MTALPLSGARAQTPCQNNTFAPWNPPAKEPKYLKGNVSTNTTTNKWKREKDLHVKICGNDSAVNNERHIFFGYIGDWIRCSSVLKRNCNSIQLMAVHQWIGTSFSTIVHMHVELII